MSDHDTNDGEQGDRTDSATGTDAAAAGSKGGGGQGADGGGATDGPATDAGRVDSARRPSDGTGLAPNVAAVLCYALGWFTGILFLVAEDEDDFVRFHAAQSVVVFGSLTVVWLFVTVVVQWMVSFVGWWSLSRLTNFLLGVTMLGGVVCWLWLLYVAYDGRWYELPIAGAIAHGITTERSTTEPVERNAPDAQ